MIDFVEIQTLLLSFLPKVGVAVLIVIVSIWLARAARAVVHRALMQHSPAPGAARLIEDVASGGIVTFGVVAGIQQFFDVTAFLAGLGIVGFTVGFALQDVMKNFAAGVILLVQQPFRIGDSVAVDQFEGTVKTIELRSTEIETFDGRVVILPNADVLNHAIVNYTRSRFRRVDLPLGVAYDTDLQKARALALQAIASLAGVQNDPAPKVIVQNFGATSVDMLVQIWVDTNLASVAVTRNGAIEAIRAAFDENGIETPSPVQTVVMKKE